MPNKRNCHHQAQNGTRISNKIIDFGSETIFFFFLCFVIKLSKHCHNLG